MAKKSTKRNRDIAERFSERYAERYGDVGLAIEREVIGVNVGLNGFTTVPQADRLVRELRLRRGMRVLDVGAGRGWPSLHLASAAGCRVVLADLPRPALRIAAARARRMRLAARCRFVQASANALPFTRDAFDAVVHTDVMC